MKLSNYSNFFYSFMDSNRVFNQKLTFFVQFIKKVPHPGLLMREGHELRSYTFICQKIIREMLDVSS